MPVPLAVRDWALGLLDEHGEDPFAVAELVGRCLAPPRLQNADGQELVFHQITWHLPDPGNAVAALRADPRLVHDGEQSFTLVRDSQNQRDTVVLTLHVEGNELCAFVNSDERAAEVNELVASLVPDAHLVDDDVVPVEEELADHRALGRAGDDASGTLDPNDPANAELYEQLAREMERRFLDEHIPALGGRTPREACDDPIGRAELERLLATFDEAPRFPGAMDPDRIRALLGLPSR